MRLANGILVSCFLTQNQNFRMLIRALSSWFKIDDVFLVLIGISIATNKTKKYNFENKKTHLQIK